MAPKMQALPQTAADLSLVTLLSVLIFQGDGGVLQTVLEGGGIAEIREKRVGDFIFGNLTVIF